MISQFVGIGRLPSSDQTTDKSDSEGPLFSGILDDGLAFVSVTSSPLLSWTAATDSGSGIAGYEIAIGTTVGGSDVKAWTSIASNTSFQVTGLSLTAGSTYYASVRAIDGSGNRSSSPLMSNGWVALGALTAIDDDIAFPSLADTPTISWTYQGTLASGFLGLQYQVAIGTTAGGANIVNWTSVGTATTWSQTGLSLTLASTYFASVRIVDSSNNIYSTVQGNGWTVTSLVTSAARYSIAPNWLDHANTATPTNACAGTENKFYSCIHGGEKRRVNYTAPATCTNYAITDELGAFDWACDATGGAGNVFFYTRGLKKGKGLTDLISATTWRNNRVVITLSGVPVAASARAAWWTTTIAALPDSPTAGTPVALASGTIYTVTGTKTVIGGYQTANFAHKVGIVVHSGSKIVIDSTATAGTYLFHPLNSNFHWLEGHFENASSATIYSFTGSISRHVVVRRAQFLKFSYGLGDTNNLAESSLFSQILSVGNGVDGLKIKGTHNIFSDIVSVGNGTDGVDFAMSYYNVFQNIVSANNGTTGMITLFGEDNNVMAVTLLSNTGIGFQSGNSTAEGVTAFNLVSLTSNAATVGVYMSQDESLTLGDIITRKISSILVTLAKFTGNLIMTTANNCFETMGTNPGITNTTCANQGSSNASLSIIAGIGDSSFVGDVVTDDTVNASDVDGVQSFASITDWLHFENPWRAWVPSTTFPAASSQGRCTSGSCRIFDFRLKSTDTQLRNTVDGVTQSAAFVNGAACPAAVHGNVTSTSVAVTPKTYLRHAMEILGTGGNNNGLCESNESCLYMPNRGAYQGTGDFWSNTCTFTNGTVTGVTMYAYPVN